MFVKLKELVEFKSSYDKLKRNYEVGMYSFPEFLDRLRGNALAADILTNAGVSSFDKVLIGSEIINHFEDDSVVLGKMNDIRFVNNQNDIDRELRQSVLSDYKKLCARRVALGSYTKDDAVKEIIRFAEQLGLTEYDAIIQNQ